MKKSNKNIMILTILIILLMIAVLFSISLGAVNITISDWISILHGEKTSAYSIIMYVRLPRLIGAVAAGAGLSVAGVIIQSVLNNPLAGPNIIGVNAGAGFFVVLFGALFPTATGILPIAAFVGALITVMLVYYIAKKTGASKMTLVLAGIAVNSFVNAATDTINTVSTISLVNSNNFRIGGLSGININVLKPACIIILVALLITFLLRNEMEVLTLGEDTAKTLGLPVSVFKFILLMLAAILAGASVSFAGLLGFIGLVVPHIARILVGGKTGVLVAVTAILGAFFLVICDLIARLIFAPYELPVGIILAFLGAPFFIYLLLRQRRHI